MDEIYLLDEDFDVSEWDTPYSGIINNQMVMI